jgi:hypothetical protein
MYVEAKRPKLSPVRTLAGLKSEAGRADRKLSSLSKFKREETVLVTMMKSVEGESPTAPPVVTVGAAWEPLRSLTVVACLELEIDRILAAMGTSGWPDVGTAAA